MRASSVPRWRAIFILAITFTVAAEKATPVSITLMSIGLSLIVVNIFGFVGTRRYSVVMLWIYLLIIALFTLIAFPFSILYGSPSPPPSSRLCMSVRGAVPRLD